MKARRSYLHEWSTRPPADAGMVIRIVAGLALVAVVAFGPQTRHARAITNRFVSTSGNDMGGTNDCTNTGQPCATIQNAINHSGPGDVIELGPGNYVENVTVDQNVTIQGDPTGSTVDGNQSGPVFFGGNAVTATLSRLTIRNGGSGDGGGIANFGTLTVTNTTISGNSVPPGRGGGILNDFGGTLTVTNSTISGNSSAVGGGIYNLATFTVTNSTISGNLATGGGGGLLNADVATLVNTTISG